MHMFIIINRIVVLYHRNGITDSDKLIMNELALGCMWMMLIELVISMEWNELVPNMFNLCISKVNDIVYKKRDKRVLYVVWNIQVIKIYWMLTIYGCAFYSKYKIEWACEFPRITTRHDRTIINRKTGNSHVLITIIASLINYWRAGSTDDVHLSRLAWNSDY